MEPTCIAMVSDFFLPDVGGVENHIYMLSANLIRRGHKVVVITHSRPPDRVGVRWMLPALKVYYIPFTTVASGATLPNYFCFLPYLRAILLRERVALVHGHAGLSSLAHEAILHAHHMGVRTVFTDHSLFGFEDAASILTNKLLVGALRNVGAVVCVSHTGRENTVLRGQLFEHAEDGSGRLEVRRDVYVIPNALVADQFKPAPEPLPRDTITIVVISRLAYRKGIDLLVATAPRICAAFPNVKFIVGGDGPKLNDLLQMRERCVLQDRIELLGPVAHSDVREVLTRGAIFLNTSLTESFGIALLEAACAGLYVVATRVGGVPEILPEDMISFARPEEDDVFRALSDAIRLVERGEHDPARAHERVRRMYDWGRVAERTEHVYSAVLASEERGLWERMQRTMDIGPFAGPIYTIILIVDCLFFLFLEWLYPREDIDYVEREWDHERFRKLAREHELDLSKHEQRDDRTGEAGRCPPRVEVGEDGSSLRDAANSNEPEGVTPALEDHSDGLGVDRLRVPSRH
ncbi:glycosyltransferase family 4 protein [Coniophora puteana RWD-64-598 SS2]|uniref:Glycosyltransferase family 4 protein n=1 Tax=Coniophora puteana (strain RWD-64-598) TaxID=741705 RepID=R7SF43_CONPW|nr:glycosyltransferase family 4 protein [Coniophora puteana RWD-64-598 SS2]EIW74367.1 glycosyltransferase family 4 protein [Coniophora puteana RWD-64-598 SS2]